VRNDGFEAGPHRTAGGVSGDVDPPQPGGEAGRGGRHARPETVDVAQGEGFMSGRRDPDDRGRVARPGRGKLEVGGGIPAGPVEELGQGRARPRR